MKDLTDPRWIKIKGVLFLFLGFFASAVLLVEHPDLKTAALLALIVWSFCRFYYFAFYVIEHYVDPNYKFSGLFSFAKYLFSRSGKTPLILLAFSAISLCVLTGCSTPGSFKSEADQLHQAFFATNEYRAYILQFDVDGHLMNFNTLFQAIDDIRRANTGPNPADAVTNVVVVSYGWNHDIDTFEKDYYDFLSSYVDFISANYGTNRYRGPKAILCVSWPSGYSMMGKSLADLLPGDTLPETLTAPLTLAFPFSVWSKASLADRIGYGDLQSSLQYLYENAYQNEPYSNTLQPNFFLIGHSFGTRVLAGAMRDAPPSLPLPSPSTVVKALVPRQKKQATFREHIKGALFIQPALTTSHLPDPTNCANFPLLITQSQHDHINNLLFPIASLPFNTYLSTEIDERAAGWLYRRPRGTNSAPSTNAVASYLRRLGFESLRIPLSAIDSAEILPFSFVKGQMWEFGPGNWTWRTNYLTSTLAHIPLVQIPIQAWVNKGYHKGIFDFGYWHESAARVNFSDPPTLSNLHPVENVSLNGIHYINCDDIISRSLFGNSIDYTKPLLNYTVGYIDPVGAHDDYSPHTNKSGVQVFNQIHSLLNPGQTNSP